MDGLVDNTPHATRPACLCHLQSFHPSLVVDINRVVFDFCQRCAIHLFPRMQHDLVMGGVAAGENRPGEARRGHRPDQAQRGCWCRCLLLVDFWCWRGSFSCNRWIFPRIELAQACQHRRHGNVPVRRRGMILRRGRPHNRGLGWCRRRSPFRPDQGEARQHDQRKRHQPRPEMTPEEQVYAHKRRQGCQTTAIPPSIRARWCSRRVKSTALERIGASARGVIPSPFSPASGPDCWGKQRACYQGNRGLATNRWRGHNAPRCCSERLLFGEFLFHAEP